VIESPSKYVLLLGHHTGSNQKRMDAQRQMVETNQSTVENEKGQEEAQ
jgi:hypothetical protein